MRIGTVPVVAGHGEHAVAHTGLPSATRLDVVAGTIPSSAVRNTPSRWGLPPTASNTAMLGQKVPVPP